MKEMDNDVINLINRIIDTREKLRPAILRGVANKGALKRATQQKDVIKNPFTGTVGSGDGRSGP